MKNNQYDSDALKDDLDTVNHRQSNLGNVANQNMEFISTSNQFITNIECMSILSITIIML